MASSSAEDKPASDPSLDFASPSFDALKALHTEPSRLQLPYPNVQPCDNLDAYDSVVHGRRRQVHITQTDDSHTNPPDNVGVVPSEQGGGTSSQVRTREQKTREIETVLDYMLKSDSSPLELLRVCHRDSVSVHVWIRHCVGVRGVCEGVPTAFDRHMNVVLRDVIERYVPFRTVANGGVVAKKRKRKKSKKELLNVGKDETSTGTSDSTAALLTVTTHSHFMQNATTRRHKQLFIRGDNVIMICRQAQVT